MAQDALSPAPGEVVEDAGIAAASAAAEPGGLCEVSDGELTIRGISVAGIYTSLAIPQWQSVFDIGVAVRSNAGCRHLFLSHAHADHIGALGTLLGMRGVQSGLPPLRIYLPAEIAADVEAGLHAWARLQRFAWSYELLPLRPGDEVEVKAGLSVRAVRAFHPVPCLGYLFFHQRPKLRAEFRELPGAEVARLRREGADLFEVARTLQCAYLTDTLVNALDAEPDLLRARTLIMECSFLDERKNVAVARQGCHVHLDELVARAADFANEHLVLMHISQLFSPQGARALLHQRLAPLLAPTLHVLAPRGGHWFG